MVNLKLKQAILNWLIENPNQWCRVTACKEKFRAYIYDVHGEYLIGGDEVAKFIENADTLLFGDCFN